MSQSIIFLLIFTYFLLVRKCYLYIIYKRIYKLILIEYIYIYIYIERERERERERKYKQKGD